MTEYDKKTLGKILGGFGPEFDRITSGVQTGNEDSYE